MSQTTPSREVKIEKYKSPRKYERGAQQMYREGWSIGGETSRRKRWSWMTGILTRKQVITVTWVRLRHRRTALRAGIDAKAVSPHALRHTFAIRALRNGARRQLAVAKLLGHASVVTTQRYLDHLETAELRTAILAPTPRGRVRLRPRRCTRVCVLGACGATTATPTPTPTAGTQAVATAEPLPVIAQQFSSLRQACDDELNREKQGISNDLPSLQHAATLAVATYDDCAQQLTAIAMPAAAQADQKRPWSPEFDKFPYGTLARR